MTTPEQNPDDVLLASQARAWELAVVHVERAERLLDQARELWEAAQSAAVESQQIAMAYLAAGGFDDKLSYRSLGLPWGPGETAEPFDLSSFSVRDDDAEDEGPVLFEIIIECDEDCEECAAAEDDEDPEDD